MSESDMKFAFDLFIYHEEWSELDITTEKAGIRFGDSELSKLYYMFENKYRI